LIRATAYTPSTTSNVSKWKTQLVSAFAAGHAPGSPATAFGTLGDERCADGSVEPGFVKLAIYDTEYVSGMGHFSARIKRERVVD
jgi:hypothetical protein